MAARTADARWTGDLKGGEGHLSLGSGAFEGKYTFNTRFEDGEGGANPEELIGAANGACFSMQLANELDQAGHTVDSVETKASVTLRQQDGLPTITEIHLDTKVTVDGLDEEEFQRVAEEAKVGLHHLPRALAPARRSPSSAELASG